MTTATTASPHPQPTGYTSPLPRGRDGFRQLLHAEWTKLRTVRRWSLTLLGAVLVTILASLLSAQGNHTSGGEDTIAVTAAGTTVRDNFRFVHQSLTGDGSVTVRVASIVPASGRNAEHPPTLSPWTKAGLIAKASTVPGSGYAAVMLTPGHGVRFQHDFTGDTAGSSAGAGTSRWLRLTRTGPLVTGYESADGTTWRKVGSAKPAGLPDTIEVGMFTTSPETVSTDRSFSSTSVRGELGMATATFEHYTADGRITGALRPDDVRRVPQAGDGQPLPGTPPNASTTENGVYTLTAAGDIAPYEPNTDLVRQGIRGTLMGLIPLAALGVLFITAEFRRGMIRTTFTASPRRGRVLAAKALVLGGVTFAAGLLAAAVSFAVTRGVLRDNGFKPPMFADATWSDSSVFRALVGTGAVMALVTVCALAVGTLLRNTAAGIALVVVVMVLPQILIPGLPLGAARFLVQSTPMAGLAIQNTTRPIPQVDSTCLPEEGCYTYGPYAGLGVLAAYAALLLALAIWQLRRRKV